MAEPVDLRSVASLIRRRWRLLTTVALAGAVVGVALVTVRPPLYTSTSQVLLPPASAQANGEKAAWEATTQVSIAESDAVLGPASRSVTPSLSRREIRRLVQVSAPTADVLTIRARGSSEATAEALARAVAEAEVAYQAEATSSLSAAELALLRSRRADLESTRAQVESEIEQARERLTTEDPNSSVGRRDASALGQLTAQQTDLVLEVDALDTKIEGAQGSTTVQIIETASPADRPKVVTSYVLASASLALLGALVAMVALLVLSRRDAKLRTRDEISDAVGSAVIASVRSEVPRTVAAWTSLLSGYTPSVVDGWTLRQALAHVGLDDRVMRGSGPRATTTSSTRHLLCVASLADDARALSVGPQIASYAASIGVSTLLVADQGDATSALWAACSSQPTDEELRTNLTVASRRIKRPPELTVFVTVLDRRNPVIPRLEPSAVLVLAVSSRAATSEDLARTAVAAYESGFRVTGVVVAEPDPLDRTTGRLLPHERLQQAPLPSRVIGTTPGSLRDSSRSGGAR